MAQLTRIVRLLAVCAAALAVAGSAERRGYVPEKGFVPNATTAVRIAEAVLGPIYGDEHIAQEEPFTATLKDGTWTVQGHLPAEYKGGVACVEISKSDGRILYVMHGQ
jgi:hypothetical protein